MYQLRRQQLVRTDLQTCWEFFSAPQNLAVIMPDYMRFRVLTEQPPAIYEGLMIAYKVSPVLGIPLKWITEIKTVRDKTFFVDEQRKGPYRMWHHEHHFQEVDGGVLMTDIVSYMLPYGFIGKLAHWLFVKRQLEAIFEYRYKIIESRFP
jgi:ligand-binding SRPBCC domain-containing protein